MLRVPKAGMVLQADQLPVLLVPEKAYQTYQTSKARIPSHVDLGLRVFENSCRACSVGDSSLGSGAGSLQALLSWLTELSGSRRRSCDSGPGSTGTV